jgi:hypothetical protein
MPERWAIPLPLVGRGKGGGSYRQKNRVENNIDVKHDVAVGKLQDTIALRVEKRCALCITRTIVGKAVLLPST